MLMVETLGGGNAVGWSGSRGLWWLPEAARLPATLQQAAALHMVPAHAAPCPAHTQQPWEAR